MTSICLNMIVKNEAAIIERCLASVRPYIDHWVIVDTGSDDGTQARVRDILAGIPGRLYEQEWKDFGFNRTEALRLAEGTSDYILLCDADMTLAVGDPAWKESLSADAYLVRQSHRDGTSYYNIRLVSAHRTGGRRWRYWGSTHEYIGADEPGMAYTKEKLESVHFTDHSDGGSRQNKYTRDAALLERDIREYEELESSAVLNPAHREQLKASDEAGLLYTRAVFYLAQTYRDAGQLAISRETYLKRAGLGGWPEEVWFSLFEAARLSERLGDSTGAVLENYLHAYQYRPSRAEPLVELARLYRQRREYGLAHLFAGRAIQIPKPDDVLFLDNSAYGWRAEDEYAVACYWIGNYGRCAELCESLLAKPSVPAEQRPRITENLALARRALG
jgi:glycosyltransferase involved in cell wall biosynthesis